MFRRPVVVRRGPGLLGAVAVGGAAYAAGSAAARNRAENEAQSAQIAQLQAEQGQQAQAQAYAAPPPQAYAPAPQPAPAPPPPPAAGGITDEQLNQLERLGQLKAQGILTDEELAAQKAKILGT
jgi:hypothetical protein